MGLALKLDKISKRYGGFAVLQNIHLEMEAGEILGLVGENGSGKSTLLKILGGHPDIAASGGHGGTIYIDGQAVKISNPARALKTGIGTVHQELALIEGFTVAENISLAQEQVLKSTGILGSGLAALDAPANQARSAAVMARLGTTLNPGLKVSGLPLGLKCQVEIGRELLRSGLRLLILDEPTASLGAAEAARLLDILRELASAGLAVIFVSHRLEEVMEVADRIMVLRDGETAGVFSAGDGYDPQQIARAMLGRDIPEVKAQIRQLAGDNIIRLCGFTVRMPGETLEGINLDVRKGEILGLAGLAGHGKAAIGAGIAGLWPHEGQLWYQGKELESQNARQRLRSGIYYLPDERRLEGLLLEQSVAYNIIFPALHFEGRFRRQLKTLALPWMHRRKARAYAEEMAGRFGIQCRSVEQKVRHLSGGNQQKVCLARATSLQPELLLVNEPTRGVDIGAKSSILEALMGINRERGSSIICSGSELRELQTIADRIAVFYEGRLGEIYEPDNPELPLAMAGAQVARAGTQVAMTGTKGGQ